MSETTISMAIRKTVSVGVPVERAFTLFTRDIASWWPLDAHALRPGEIAELIFEERVGGEVYEISTGGERGHWATVLEWDPPSRLVLAWEVNPSRLGTEIEVRFSPEDGGTCVELEHRGWERVAADAAELRASYDTGWEHVLGRFVASA
jgi:uncharacterized protein YndB with AHSA1/START domain